MGKATTTQILTTIKEWVLGKMDDIRALIPSQASTSNQLADKAFVNSSIATETATFRGTYNVVTDLSLAYNATHSLIASALATKMTALSITPDNNDYAFVQIPTSDATPTEIAKVEKYKYNGSAWGFEYELNNSGFTAAQWAAINSGATLELIGKLAALPTNAELTTLLNAKASKVTNATAGNLAGLDAGGNLTDSGIGLGDNGAYDVTAHNSGATFASLSALLSSQDLSTLIPVAVRKGGMSIKFVLTSDNKYVQWRLMAQSFSINVSDWQGVEVTPSLRSKNLLESGGAELDLYYKQDRILGENLIDPNRCESSKAISWGGAVVTVGTSDFTVSDYIPVNGQNIISNAFSTENAWSTYNVYDANKEFLRTGGTNRQYTYQSGDAYVRFSFLSTNKFANYGTTLTDKAFQYDVLPSILSDMTDEIENVKSDIDAVDDKFDNIINGTVLVKTVTAAAATNINTTVTVPFLKAKKWIKINIASEDSILTNKGFSIYVSTTTFGLYSIPQPFICNGGEVLFQLPYDLIGTSVIIQQTTKDWTTQVSANIEFTDFGLSSNLLDLEETVNGNSFIGKSRVNSGNVINSTFSDARFTPNLKIKVKIVSDSSRYIDKSVSAMAFVSSWTLIGKVKVNGPAQELTIPSGATGNKLLFQCLTTATEVTIITTTIEIIPSIPQQLNALKEIVGKIPDEISGLVKTAIGTYKQYNIIDVGVGYTYQDIQSAINSVTDAAFDNRYLIMVHNDQYATQISDLWLLSDTSTHASSNNQGCAYIITKDYVDIMGANRPVLVSVLLPSAAAGSVQYTYCHCLFEKGDVRIFNMVFESAYTRYTMHEENGTSSLDAANSNKKKWFKNVTFRYLQGFSYNQALGIGSAPGEECLYENCIIESFFTNEYNVTYRNNGIGNLHSHPNYKFPFTYIFRNCYISTYSGFSSPMYTDINSGVKPTFIFENCDFGAIEERRSPTSLGDVNLDDKGRNWRAGGFYLEGHSNIGYLKNRNASCLYLESNNNNVSVDVIGGTAFELLFSDSIRKYAGKSDSKGMYIGSELVVDDATSNISLQKRLGDCSTTNKTLIISIGGTEQTVTLSQDYTQMADASAVLSSINSNISNAIIKLGIDIEIMSWGDNTKYVKNTGTSTINLGDVVTRNSAFASIKKAGTGDFAFAVAAERINSGDWGKVIIKSNQYFREIGGLNTEIITGTNYACGANGTLVESNSEPQFECIGNGLIAWIM